MPTSRGLRVAINPLWSQGSMASGCHRADEFAHRTRVREAEVCRLTADIGKPIRRFLSEVRV